MACGFLSSALLLLLTLKSNGGACIFLNECLSSRPGLIFIDLNLDDSNLSTKYFSLAVVGFSLREFGG